MTLQLLSTALRAYSFGFESTPSIPSLIQLHTIDTRENIVRGLIIYTLKNVKQQRTSMEYQYIAAHI